MNHLLRDVGIIALSVLLAVFLYSSGTLQILVNKTETLPFLGSFLAGIFFVSIFTAAPATAAFAVLAQSEPLISLALIGGLGALLGDYLIFRFVKSNLSEDLMYLMHKIDPERIKIFRSKIFGWLIPFIGALIIASPLPDEIGLVMLGLSKIKTAVFLPLSFALNSIGIFII